MPNVDLNQLISDAETALVGREEGRSFRRQLNLEALETEAGPIIFIIPDHVVSMNRSFFLGAFADRIKALGKTAFKEKYHFQTSEHILKKIEDHIDNALKEASPEQILNV